MLERKSDTLALRIVGAGVEEEERGERKALLCMYGVEVPKYMGLELGLASSLGVEVRRQTHRERERVDGRSARVHHRHCRFRTVVDFGVTAKGIGSMLVVRIRRGGRRRDCVHRG